MTQQDLLAAALQASGWTEVRSNNKYRKFRRPDDLRYMLVGSAGACRITTGSVANSHPVSNQRKTSLLAEGKVLTQHRTVKADAEELGL